MNSRVKKRRNNIKKKILNSILNLNHKKTKISLEERFANYKGKNQAKDFTWDDSKGKEIW